MLWHVIRRVKEMKCGKIIVATTKRKMDDEIINIAKSLHVNTFRGETNNVLDRYYKASMRFNGDIIVRITADCPLIDPNESRKIVDKFLEGGYDYVSNGSQTYPNGVSTECFSFYSLEKAWNESRLRSEKEHVTPYIWKNPDKFRIFILHRKDKKKLNHLRWSVDYKDDLEFVRKIFSKLYKNNRIFKMNDVLRLLKKNPELSKINSQHDNNEGYKISLKKD